MRTLAVALVLLALPARADLVTVDLVAPGDGLVTRDTEAGLDWLELAGVTTGLSYDARSAGSAGDAEIRVFATDPPSNLFRLVSRATPDAVPTSASEATRGSFLVGATPPAVPALPLARCAALEVALALAARATLRA